MDYLLYQSFWRLQEYALKPDVAVKGDKAKDTWKAILHDVDKVGSEGRGEGMVKKGYVRGQRGNEELQAGQGSNTINFPTCDLVSHESAGFPTSAAATIAAAPLLDTFTLLYSIVGIFVGEVVLCVWPLCGSMSTSVPTSCYPPPPTLFPSHARYSTVQYTINRFVRYANLFYILDEAFF